MATTLNDVAGYHEETGAEKSLSVTITVEKAPSDYAQYFWVQQFWLDVSIDHSGYIGMQIGEIIHGQRVGKIWIVFMWNASNATAEDAPADCKEGSLLFQGAFLPLNFM